MKISAPAPESSISSRPRKSPPRIAVSTLAMSNMAPIAGTASSVQGVTGSVGGAAIGFVIGQQFDGSTLPFLIGLVGCGIMALVVVLVTERGVLLKEKRQKLEPMPECNP